MVLRTGDRNYSKQCLVGTRRYFKILPTGSLQVEDVRNLIAGAVTLAARDGANVVVAVSDREGVIPGLYDMPGAPTTAPDIDLVNRSAVLQGNPNQAERFAIEKARATAFLSSDQMYSLPGLPSL